MQGCSTYDIDSYFILSIRLETMDYIFHTISVIKGKIVGRVERIHESFTEVEVGAVYQRNTVPIQLNTTAIVNWTNPRCMCPVLTLGKDYLLMGYEDSASNSLIFRKGSLAKPWVPKLDKRIRVS